MRAGTSAATLLVEALCSEECAGRAPGTAGGVRARGIVMESLRAAGLSPVEQAIATGANVLATIPGRSPRWVMVAAHYDHLGSEGGAIYPGADDNASGVAVLMQVAQALAGETLKRGVLIAAFDAEEPPHFLESTMGSEEWAWRPTVPLDALDLMVCLDVVGHGLGPPGLPDEVRHTLFALGAERSAGTAALVDRLARSQPGVIVRRLDAEIIPPLSDYAAFARRQVPFLFLSCGRDRRYHTPDDTPGWLDWSKTDATARWVEHFVRETCDRAEERLTWLSGARDDASTLRTLVDVTSALTSQMPLAVRGQALAKSLLAACRPDGRLPEAQRSQLQSLAVLLEEGLA